MRWTHAMLRASQLAADLVQLTQVWCRIEAEASSPASPRELPVSSDSSKTEMMMGVELLGLAVVAQDANEADCLVCLSFLSRLTPALIRTLGSDGLDPAPLLDLLTSACSAARQYSVPPGRCTPGALLPFSTSSGASEADYVRRMGRALAHLHPCQTPDQGARDQRMPAVESSSGGDDGGSAEKIGGRPLNVQLVPDAARLLMLRSCFSCACWALWALGCI